MKNATVTMPFNDFMAIKNKADELEKEVGTQYQRDVFYEGLAECIEKAATTDNAKHKQFYLFKGLEFICDFYQMDIKEEYGDVDPGIAPGIAAGLAVGYLVDK